MGNGRFATIVNITDIYHQSFERELTAEEATYLDEVLAKYPYFSLAHYLKAKYQADDEHIFFASAYSVNRTQLKQYLKGNCLLFAPEKVLEPEKETEMMQAREEEIDQVSFPPSEELSHPPQVKQSESDGLNHHGMFAILEFPEEEVDTTDQHTLFEVPLAEHKPSPFLKLQAMIEIKVLTYGPLIASIQRQIRQYKTVEPAAKESTSVEQEAPEEKAVQNSSANLIDRFLKLDPRKRPRAKPGKTKPIELPQAQSSIEKDDEMVTETLALLLLKQNNKAEALQMYRKLRLRFPQKSAYFDDQIKKITNS